MSMQVLHQLHGYLLPRFFKTVRSANIAQHTYTVLQVLTMSRAETSGNPTMKSFGQKFIFFARCVFKDRSCMINFTQYLQLTRVHG